MVTDLNDLKMFHMCSKRLAQPASLSRAIFKSYNWLVNPLAGTISAGVPHLTDSVTHLKHACRCLCPKCVKHSLAGFSHHHNYHVKVGDEARISKIFTEKEVLAFAEITGDTNPLHLDPSFAQNSHFHQPVVHGILTLG